MRVCFGTLCFSSRLNTAADEEAPQVVTANGGSHVVFSAGPVANGAMAEGYGYGYGHGDGGGGGGNGTEALLRLLTEKDEEIKRLKTELAERNREIYELRSQLDKFQSVMAITHSHPASPKGLGSQLRTRKQRAGISAEPQNEQSILELRSSTFPTIYKNESSRELIKAAILDNDFMKNLELTQIREIVDCMYPEEYTAGTIIIQEGDVGSIVYVLEAEVCKKCIKVLRCQRNLNIFSSTS